MRLAAYDGSPKGERGNSNFLLRHFLDGVMETPGHSYELAHLSKVKEQERFVELFTGADAVILAFPLYTDMMPGIVKAFFESLEPLCGREGNPPIGFIIQSGFPESVHMRALESYLEKLSRRLGCRYLGTVLRGGVEGMRTQPAFVIRGLLSSIRELGRGLGRTGELDQELIRRIGKRERLSPLRLLFTRTIGSWMAKKAFWDRRMKENNAYERRLARPYEQPPA